MERYSKQELEKYINEEMSYNAIGRLYGVSGTAIKKAAKKFGIELKPKRIINESENFSHINSGKKSIIYNISDDEFITIIKESKLWTELANKLGYNGQISSNVKKAIQKRCSSLGIEMNLLKKEDILSKTKGELFEYRKNWQSARTAIQKLARKIYKEECLKQCCAICGYDKQVEVAHIKAVSEFDDSATVKEINSINNLIGLCPNHHWEYDHGLLKL